MPRSIAGRWCCLRRGSWRHSERLGGLKVDLPATTPARRTGDTQPQNARRSHFARQQFAEPNVRDGSKADIAERETNVCFAPKADIAERG